MLELLKSLLMAIIMVPVLMAFILGMIWAVGELFNLISGTRNEHSEKEST